MPVKPPVRILALGVLEVTWAGAVELPELVRSIF